MKPDRQVGAVMQAARNRLRTVSDTAGMDVQLLLSHVSGRNREELLAHPEYYLSADEEASFEDLVKQYLAGAALPHLLGWWEFYGRRFEITPDVLIPRPETELLVERALALMPGEQTVSILDVGTGSGIIAVSLLYERPQWQGTAVDFSRAALQTACKNRALYDLQSRLDLVQGDLAGSFAGPFDLICANLPYIPSEKLEKLIVAAREPRIALDGGEDGLDLVHRLLLDVPRLLCSGGAALFEIEAGQGEDVLSFAQQNLPGTTSCIYQDLAGRDRILEVVIS